MGGVAETREVPSFEGASSIFSFGQKRAHANPPQSGHIYLAMAFRCGLIGIVKGQEKLKPRFVLTTEQTSVCHSDGDYNFKAIYFMDPLAVQVIVTTTPMV